jgi:hypothetical protein
MDRELKKAGFDEPKPAKETRPKRIAPCALNLCFIDSPAFHRHTWKRESAIMITSMYEINRLIKNKKRVASTKSGSKDNIIKAKLLDWLKDYKDCFSKKALDEISPH